MASKIFTVILLIGSAVACARSSPTKPDSGVIGEVLAEATPLLSPLGLDATTTFVVDEPSRRIHKVEVDPLRIVESYPLAKPTEVHTVAAPSSGAYVLDFSTKHLDIIRAGGKREARPFKFQGTPVSSAYAPDRGIFVMLDSLHSVGLMMLDEDGDVAKAWLGGSLVTGDGALLAGDIDAKGRLILATSTKTITVVDVESSIDAQTWKTSSFAIDLDGIKWVAPDSAHPNLVLVATGNTVAIIDVESKSVVEKIVPEQGGRFISGGFSKTVRPHVIAKNVGGGRGQLLYIGADGRLAKHDLPNESLLMPGLYLGSHLDKATTELTALMKMADGFVVVSLRLTDNLVTAEKEVKGAGTAVLGADSLFVNRKTQLGYLQRYDLGDEGVQELKGFNFSYFRGK